MDTDESKLLMHPRDALKLDFRYGSGDDKSAPHGTLQITIGSYTFTLLCRNAINPNKHQMVVIQSQDIGAHAEMPLQVAVYRSHSQVQWRLGITSGSSFVKFSDYTSTTQVHPMLQEFIESNYEDILIVSDDDPRVKSRTYNYMYYYQLITGKVYEEDTVNMGVLLNKINEYIDTSRIELDPTFYLLSSHVLELGTSSSERIAYLIEKVKPIFGAKFPVLQAELDTYMPKTHDGKFKELGMPEKIKIINKYLADKLTVIPNNAQLEYYIDPANNVLSVENADSNLDRTAMQDEQFRNYNTNLSSGHTFRTPLPSKRYLAIKQAAGNKFDYNTMIKHKDNRPEVRSTITIFDRSPAVLSVGIRGKVYPFTNYRLYYFDYRYRGKRYMIPLNIVYDGMSINKLGLPYKYIPLGIYAAKIMDYIQQVDFTAGKQYDLYYVNHQTIYTFTGALYKRMWPLALVPNLKHIGVVASTYKYIHNPMEETVYGYLPATKARARMYNLPHMANIAPTARAMIKSRSVKKGKSPRKPNSKTKKNRRTHSWSITSYPDSNMSNLSESESENEN